MFVLRVCLKLGHSRTVFGIEERKNKNLCLLVFDPGCSSQEMQKIFKAVDGNSLRLFRRFLANLKHKQYQIVAIDGVLSEEEKVVSMPEESNYWGRSQDSVNKIGNATS